MSDNTDARSRLAAMRDSSGEGGRLPSVQSVTSSAADMSDTGSMAWFAFGMMLPVPGFVMWLLNRNESPDNCSRLIKGTITGLILSVVLSLVMFGIAGTVGDTISKLVTASSTNTSLNTAVSESWTSGNSSIAQVDPDAFTTEDETDADGHDHGLNLPDSKSEDPEPIVQERVSQDERSSVNVEVDE